MMKSEKVRLIVLAVLVLTAFAEIHYLNGGFVGHSSSTLTQPTAAAAQKLSDKEKIYLLRTEAHKRDLKWRITCATWNSDPDQQFLGMVWPKDGADSLYIEQGSKGEWLNLGPTQADVAYALYQAIQGPVTHPAEHKEAPKPKKFCPPELRGE